MYRLTYIYHDCFMLETGAADFVFDFFKDPLAGSDGKPLFLRRRDRDKPLYVMVSHHHKDHYDRSIFGWQKEYPAVRYVISRDVARHARHILTPGSVYAGPRPEMSSVKIMSPGDTLQDGDVLIRAFGSTDIGNSWVVETDGLRVFHAGDLNAWIWKDESTEPEVRAAVRDFEVILGQIEAVCPRIDLAMFPVDSRIGRDYWTGARIFLERMPVGVFVPMHFCLAESGPELTGRRLDASDFDAYRAGVCKEYVALQAPYDCLMRQR